MKYYVLFSNGIQREFDDVQDAVDTAQEYAKADSGNFAQVLWVQHSQTFYGNAV